MNDRYLFKAKRIDNGEWVEGFYLTIGDKTYIICEAETCCMDAENTDLYATEWYEVQPETVCRCTGLTDKNYNSIWENDVVQYEDKAAIIRFGMYGDEHLGFYVDFPEKTCYRKDLGFWHRKIIVVGNCIDEPGLVLEVEA